MTNDLLRELSELRPGSPTVLSLYLDLDPSQFATGEARESAVTSLLDGAHRAIESSDAGREHQQVLRADLEDARAFFATDDYAEGARSVALFCCRSAGLFRAEKLSHPVETRAYLGDHPAVEPLMGEPGPSEWGVLLVNRAAGRLLRGNREKLEEEGTVHDEPHGSHGHADVSEELKGHLDRVGESLRVAHGRRPFSALLLGGQSELLGLVEERLPEELRKLVGGHFTANVEHGGADDVLVAARPAMEEHERRYVEEQLDRLRTGSAHGTGVLGLEDVLGALNEHRVELLMTDDYFDAAGVECPSCGWLGLEGIESCPADGTATDPRERVAGPAMRRAAEQSARLLALGDREDLRPVGGIAAVLRF
jgi:hypothetical protein